jgi:hypothetical protein
VAPYSSLWFLMDPNDPIWLPKRDELGGGGIYFPQTQTPLSRSWCLLWLPVEQREAANRRSCESTKTLQQLRGRGIHTLIHNHQQQCLLAPYSSLLIQMDPYGSLRPELALGCSLFLPLASSGCYWFPIAPYDSIWLQMASVASLYLHLSTFDNYHHFILLLILHYPKSIVHPSSPLLPLCLLHHPWIL